MGNVLEKFESLPEEEQARKIVDKINIWSDHIILQMARYKKLRNISPKVFNDKDNYSIEKKLIRSSWLSKKLSPFNNCSYKATFGVTPRMLSLVKDLESSLVEECDLNYQMMILRRRNYELAKALLALKELQRRNEVALNKSMANMRVLAEKLDDLRIKKYRKRRYIRRELKSGRKVNEDDSTDAGYSGKGKSQQRDPDILPDDIQQVIEIETTDESKPEPKKKRKVEKKKELSIPESDHLYAKRFPDSDAENSEDEGDYKHFDLGVD